MSSSNITLHAFEDLLGFWWISNVMWSSTFRGFFSVFFYNVDFRVTFRKVIMRKSVGDYSGTPYVTTLLNCLLWVFYGSSAVTNTTLIISINGAGLALEAIYICIHLFYGTDDSRVQIYFFTISPTNFFFLFPQTNSSDPSSLTFLIFLEQLGIPKLITMEFLCFWILFTYGSSSTSCCVVYAFVFAEEGWWGNFPGSCDLCYYGHLCHVESCLGKPWVGCGLYLCCCQHTHVCCTSDYHG